MLQRAHINFKTKFKHCTLKHNKNRKNNMFTLALIRNRGSNKAHRCLK